jgi:hypothetical protein
VVFDHRLTTACRAGRESDRLLHAISSIEVHRPRPLACWSNSSQILVKYWLFMVPHGFAIEAKYRYSIGQIPLVKNWSNTPHRLPRLGSPHAPADSF